MKKEIILFILSTTLILPFSCSKDRVKTYNENGVLIIENHDSPIFDKKLFELHKILSIGQGEGDPNYTFCRPSGLAIDSEDNIYVLDSGNYRIQTFDSRGNHLKTIGRKGKGPGEFIFPFRMTISTDDKIITFDNGNKRFQYFDISGKLAGSFNWPHLGVLRGLVFDSKGNILILHSLFTKLSPVISNMVSEIRLEKYDCNGKLINTIYRSNPLVASEVSDLASFGRLIGIDTNDLVYLPSLDRDKYEINVYNYSGTQIKKIKRIGCKPSSYSEYEKEANKNVIKHRKLTMGLELKFHEFRPMIEAILVDQKDRLWVFSGEHEKKNEVSIDIFDKNGRYLYKFIAEHLCRFAKIKKNKFYQLIESKDGYPVLEIYEIIENLHN